MMAFPSFLKCRYTLLILLFNFAINRDNRIILNKKNHIYGTKYILHGKQAGQVYGWHLTQENTFDLYQTSNTKRVSHKRSASVLMPELVHQQGGISLPVRVFNSVQARSINRWHSPGGRRMHVNSYSFLWFVYFSICIRIVGFDWFGFMGKYQFIRYACS